MLLWSRRRPRGSREEPVLGRRRSGLGCRGPRATWAGEALEGSWRMGGPAPGCRAPAWGPSRDLLSGLPTCCLLRRPPPGAAPDPGGLAVSQLEPGWGPVCLPSCSPGPCLEPQVPLLLPPVAVRPQPICQPPEPVLPLPVTRCDDTSLDPGLLSDYWGIKALGSPPRTIPLASTRPS